LRDESPKQTIGCIDLMAFSDDLDGAPSPKLIADQLELRALVDRYALAVDNRDPEELGSLFHDDGGVDVYLAGRPQPVAQLRGPTQFAQMLDGLKIYRATMHFVTNCVIRVTGDSASGTAYCVARHYLEDGDDSRDEMMVLTYDDRFVRTGDGWRFRVRAIHRRWTEQVPAGQAPLEIDLQMAGQRRRS
jgi:hypothetical protein